MKFNLQNIGLTPIGFSIVNLYFFYFFLFFLFFLIPNNTTLLDYSEISWVNFYIKDLNEVSEKFILVLNEDLSTSFTKDFLNHFLINENSQKKIINFKEYEDLVKEIIKDNLLEFSNSELQNYLESFVVLNDSFFNKNFFNKEYTLELSSNFHDILIAKFESFFVEYYFNNMLVELKTNLTEDLIYQFSDDKLFLEVNKKQLKL